MTNYRNGADLERATRKLLEANGYYVVRSGGSKGAADLVALKRGEVVLVQCKLDGYLRPAERHHFADLAGTLDAVPVVSSWHKEGRAARTVHLAEVWGSGAHTWVADWSPDWALDERVARA